MFGFIGRQHLRTVLGDSELRADVFGGTFIIAREHHDAFDAARSQSGDDVLGFRAERINDSENPDEFAALCHIKNGLAFSGKALDVLKPRRHVHPFVFFDEVARADNDLFTVNRRTDAVRHNVAHFAVVLFLKVVCAGFFRSTHNGARHRMREVLFQAGGKPQNFFLRLLRVKAHDVRKFRRSLREASGLVKHNRIDFAQSLNVAAALDEHAVFGAGLHGGENCQGCGKFQRTGVVDHQD